MKKIFNICEYRVTMDKNHIWRYADSEKIEILEETMTFIHLVDTFLQFFYRSELNIHRLNCMHYLSRISSHLNQLIFTNVRDHVIIRTNLIFYLSNYIRINETIVLANNIIINGIGIMSYKYITGLGR